MALVEAARFYTLSEAQVAASLLRSAGIEPTVSDVHYGSVFWLEQKALGGFRLSVAEEDVLDTLALLTTPPPGQEFAPYDPIEPLSNGQRALAMGLGLTLGPAAGWLATGRGRNSRPFAELLSGMIVAAVLVTVVGGVFLLVANVFLNPV